MSKKQLFCIVFFGLTLIEIGQMAYSHDKGINTMTNNCRLAAQCNMQTNTGLAVQQHSVYGQPPIMLI